MSLKVFAGILLTISIMSLMTGFFFIGRVVADPENFYSYSMMAFSSLVLFSFTFAISLRVVKYRKTLEK